MNEVIQNILNRRSVRVYSEAQIKQEDLEQILQAGLFAPSACNSQSWHFTVVQNKELLNNLNIETKKILSTVDNEMFQKMGKNEAYDIFYKAPTVIVVSGEKSSHCPQADCAAATENMMLVAESLGIGSCWIGLITYLLKSHEGEKFSTILETPDGFEPYYAFTLGYKKYPNPKPQPRRENTVSYIK